MFRNIARKIIKGLARAETPYVYLGHDQHLSYNFNDLLQRDMVFSEHTPYAVPRQHSSRKQDRVHYRLFATDTIHEHYLTLEGTFDILPATDSAGLTRISVEEETRSNEKQHIDQWQTEAPGFSDKIEFSILHMNRKYPSLTVNLLNSIPGGAITVRKLSDNTRKGMKVVSWEYEIEFEGKKYSGHDRFTYMRKHHAIMGSIDMESIPGLKGDPLGRTDFSYNCSALGDVALQLELAPTCSPYTNITKEYYKHGTIQLRSCLVSYLKDFKVSTEISSTKAGNTKSQVIPVNTVSVRSGNNILCQSTIKTIEGTRVSTLSDIEEKNDGDMIKKYHRYLESKVIFVDGKEAVINTELDCDLDRKKHADSMIDDLLDAKFE